MKEKIKWFIRELINMYSNKDSYFSKKRFESSIAFLTAVILIVWHSISIWKTISTTEIISEAVVLFGIAGYTVSKIEAEKKATSSTDAASPQKDDLVA